MMPSNYNLQLYHGDSYVWQFKLWLDENKSQPLDLTGVVPKAEIRDVPGSATIIPITCELVLPNIIAASLSSEDCRSLEVMPHVWDLQLTFPSGAVNTVLAGTVDVTSDVTDSTAAGALAAHGTVTTIHTGEKPARQFIRAARK